MAFLRCASLATLWQGEMRGCVVEGVPVVVLHLESGVHAYVDRCAHERVRLSQGILEGDVLTCTAHYWSYDARTGRGRNPDNVQLKRCAVQVKGDDIFVDVSPDEGGGQGSPPDCASNPPDERQ